MFQNFGNRPLPLFLSFGLLATLSACVGAPAPVIGPVTAVPETALGQGEFGTVQAEEYVLRADDIISVVVFREPDLTLENAPIGADGTLSLPLIGPVQAAGLNSRQFARQVEERLAGSYLTQPHVSVNVVEYRSHQVTVEGAVTKPGVFAFRPGTRLSGAIALAEGPKREANENQVAVFRRDREGMTVAKFDYAAMQKGTMIDPVIMPGDRVILGTDTLEQVWQDMLRAVPAIGLFTRL